jgi:hypothetical protein
MILRNLLASACLIAGLGSATGVAMAQQPAAPAAPAAAAYSTTDTDIGTLLDNAQTKAVIDKHLPQFSANPQIAMARSMTLQQIKSFAGDMLTDETLAKIDADLAKIPKTR